MRLIKNPNGYGSVFKLSGNRRKKFGVRITAGWTEDGKQKYQYLGYYEKRQEAIMALAEYNSNPYDLRLNSITLSEVFDSWIETKQNRSKSTLNSFYTAYNKCESIRDKGIRQLRKDDIQAIIDDCEHPTARLQIKNLFKALYSYAISKDIVDKDYSVYLNVESTKKAPKKIPFSAEEIQALWNSLGTVKDADILLILIYTGLRISELFEIRKDNIHLDKGYMVGGLKTEAGKERIIPIHESVLELVRKRYETSNIDYLMMNARGSQFKYNTFLRSQWANVTKALNLTHHTIHETRHTFITFAYRCGMDDLKVKRIVGHSDKNVTQHYTHIEASELVQEMKKFKI